MKMVIVHNS